MPPDSRREKEFNFFIAVAKLWETASENFFLAAEQGLKSFRDVSGLFLNFSFQFCWSWGSTDVERYECIPQSAANNFGEVPQKWELQIPCLRKFFWGATTLGLISACRPHTLRYACALYAPLPLSWFSLGAGIFSEQFHSEEVHPKP